MTAPATTVDALHGFAPAAAPGASRYRHTLPGGEHVDTLLVNKESDVLVVSLHGALNRRTTVLPRFERLKSINEHDVSSMYFADPALHKHEGLELAWFTGWEGFDFHRVIADWARTAALAIGATRVIFSGSSGGGFAALQAATYLPESLALPFNPQTSIYAYLAGGVSRAPQKNYIDKVWPQLAPDGVQALDPEVDWSEPLGEQTSVLRRYARPVPNYVLYAENPLEFHYDQQYLPFLAAAGRGGNLHRVRIHEYIGDERHNPPHPTVFRAALLEAVTWVRGLPPIQ